MPKILTNFTVPMIIHSNIQIDALNCTFKEMHPKINAFKNQLSTVAPIYYAATDNPGLASAALNMHTPGKTTKSKGWLVEIQSGGKLYKGWVTGIFFNQGDRVDIICRDSNTIYAIYSHAREVITMRPGILSGIKFVLANCTKVFKWIAITLAILATLFLFISNLISSAPFTDFLFQLPFIFIGSILISSLLLWISSRKEIISSYWGSKIFKILNFNNPQILVIATTERLIKMDTETGYYYNARNLKAKTG